MFSGVIQMLVCKTHKFSGNQLHQHQQLCRQILRPRPRRLTPPDPWLTQPKLQQTGESADECPVP
jgi:hypothetical protein